MRFLLLVLAVLIFCAPTPSGAVTLYWDPPLVAPGLAGYLLCYGSAAGQYVSSIDVGNVLEYPLTSLAPGTYYFAVMAYGLEGERSPYSNELALVIPDTTPPVISSLLVSSITDSSALIVWATNEDSNTQVEYGLTTSYGNVSVNGTMTQSHSQTLTGLEKGATYHFRVLSRDAAGNLGVSGDRTFMTARNRSNKPPPRQGQARIRRR